MNDVVAFFIMLVIVLVMVVSMTGLVVMEDKITDQEAAKAGLQQCVVDNRVVWQKECNNGG